MYLSMRRPYSPKQERRHNETDIIRIRRLRVVEVGDPQKVGTDDNVCDDTQIVTEQDTAQTGEETTQPDPARGSALSAHDVIR